MEWFVKAFMKASLAWLSAGVTLGLAMAAYPPWVIYRPAHMHMLLPGFVAMMIFGVGYHVIPRFAGFPLHSRRLAAAHWWISNIGLALMVTGFIVRVHDAAAGRVALVSGGVMAASGAYTFAYVIWRTLDGQRKLRAAATRAAAAENRGRLPLAGARTS